MMAALPYLGMVANSKRTLKKGTQYNSLFPAISNLQGTDKILKYGNVFTVLDTIQEIVLDTLSDTQKVALKLKGSNLNATLKNIWHFVYQHIQYKPDKAGVEQLHRPLRIWKDRVQGVDCDDYTILISSILTNLQIPHYYRMTKYDRDWQHVYVIVPKSGPILNRKDYHVLDPVVDKYDHEVPFTQNFDKKMKMPIQYLNGVPNRSLGSLNIESLGNEFDGLGFGLGSAESMNIQFLNATKKHLQNTLKNLQLIRQENVGEYGEHNRSELINQIQRVLAVWHNGILRNRLLDEFEQVELSGLSGLGSRRQRRRQRRRERRANGKGGFWNAIKRGASSVGNAVKKGARAVGQGIKKAGQAIARYNPVSAAARGGLSAYFKLNLGQSATKLGYGYYTKAQAQQLGLDMAEYEKAVSSLRRTRNLWVDVLKGDEAKLRVFILEGMAKGAKKNNLPTIPAIQIRQKNPLDVRKVNASIAGLGAEPVTTTAATAAASGFIAKIVSWIKNIDLKKIFKGAKSKLSQNQFGKRLLDNKQVNQFVNSQGKRLNNQLNQFVNDRQNKVTQRVNELVNPSNRNLPNRRSSFNNQNSEVPNRRMAVDPNLDTTVNTPENKKSSAILPIAIAAGGLLAKTLLFGAPAGLGGTPKKKRKVGRPKGSKNKKTLGKLPAASF